MLSKKPAWTWKKREILLISVELAQSAAQCALLLKRIESVITGMIQCVYDLANRNISSTGSRVFPAQVMGIIPRSAALDVYVSQNSVQQIGGSLSGFSTSRGA